MHNPINEILFISIGNDARNGALQSWSMKKFLDVRDPFLKGSTITTRTSLESSEKYSYVSLDNNEYKFPDDLKIVYKWDHKLFETMENIIFNEDFKYKNETEEKQWEEMIKALNTMFERWKQENTKIETSYDNNLFRWAAQNFEDFDKMNQLRLMLLRGFYVEVVAKLEEVKNSIRKEATIIFTLKKEDGFFNGVVQSKELGKFAFNFDSY